MPAAEQTLPATKPNVLAVQNVKGGVGKTTIAVNLATLLAARHDQRVLLILVPMLADQFAVHGLPVLLRSLDKYTDLLGIEAEIAGVVLSMFPPKREAASRANAEKYATSIAELCGGAIPPIRLLNARISRDKAYPQSFERREPLPFSTGRRHGKLIGDLEGVVAELGLMGGVS